MDRQWIMAAVSMVPISAVIVVLDAMLVGIYSLITGSGEPFIVTLSNLLFLEGGIVLLIGATIEFFHIGGRDNRMVVSPKVLFPVGGKPAAEGSGTVVEVRHPGWLLIVLAGILLLFSVTLVLLFAK